MSGINPLKRPYDNDAEELSKMLKRVKEMEREAAQLLEDAQLQGDENRGRSQPRSSGGHGDREGSRGGICHLNGNVQDDTQSLVPMPTPDGTLGSGMSRVISLSSLPSGRSLDRATTGNLGNGYIDLSTPGSNDRVASFTGNGFVPYSATQGQFGSLNQTTTEMDEYIDKKTSFEARTDWIRKQRPQFAEILTPCRCVLLFIQHVLHIRYYQLGPDHERISLYDGSSDGFLRAFWSKRRLPDEEIAAALFGDNTAGLSFTDMMAHHTLSKVLWSLYEFQSYLYAPVQGDQAGESGNETGDRNAPFLTWDPSVEPNLESWINRHSSTNTSTPGTKSVRIFNKPCMLMVWVDTVANAVTNIPNTLDLHVGAFTCGSLEYYSHCYEQLYMLMAMVTIDKNGRHHIHVCEPGQTWTLHGTHDVNTIESILPGESCFLLYAEFEEDMIDDIQERNQKKSFSDSELAIQASFERMASVYSQVKIQAGVSESAVAVAGVPMDMTMDMTIDMTVDMTGGQKGPEDNDSTNQTAPHQSQPLCTPQR
ncbi:unnamed protein product [Clonostachys byssicola]|uniref:Uncharacterized protein n=1 Tax=Clonostachys byssicola TaxID=160290 RepID=A0A9N9Y5G3_9HYPO|nr:unnamed protein product [Clonostachys byssicola]